MKIFLEKKKNKTLEYGHKQYKNISENEKDRKNEYRKNKL